MKWSIFTGSRIYPAVRYIDFARLFYILTILLLFIPRLKDRSSFLTASILSILSHTKVRDFVIHFKFYIPYYIL